jgi:hypothetical protein
MHHHALSRSLRSAFPACLLLAAIAPMACAVAIEPELHDDEGGSAGTLTVGGTSAGTGVVTPQAGTTSTAFGGTSPTAGSSSSSGTTSSAGKGGSISSGGKTSSGGQSQGGTSSAGKGTGGVTTAGKGTGGSTSTGCGPLKAWKGGDSTLTIDAGEVIQWMGKRYKATASIAYPNAECAPDMPATWCATWFTADGSC